MNIKNRLQKITIILATFLILFNFMGGNVARATSDDKTAMQYINSSQTHKATYKQEIIDQIKTTCSVDDNTAENILSLYGNEIDKIRVKFKTVGSGQTSQDEVKVEANKVVEATGFA